MKQRSLLVLGILLLVLCSCTVRSTAAISTSTPPARTEVSAPRPTPTLRGPTRSPTETRRPTPTSTLEVLPSPRPTHVLPVRELDPRGPWLLVWEGSTIAAFNADGSGYTALLEDEIVNFSFSPDDRTLALIVDANPSDESAGLQLQLMDLPAGPVRAITELQAPDLIPPEEEDALGTSFEAMRAISMTSPRWSHNGEFIAFVGQQDGPTADLYVYTRGSSQIRRLTDGPSQAYAASWSPDDQYIFHAGAWSFGTGAGYSNAGSWVVARDGSRLVETTTGQGSDVVLVWQNPRRFILASWSQPCGLGFLQSHSIDTGDAQPIWPYYIDDYAYLREAGQLAVLVPPDFENCTETGQPTGLFLLDGPNSEPQLVSDQEFLAVRDDPSSASAYLVWDDHDTFRLTSAGELSSLGAAPPANPVYSEKADLWAWYGSWQDASGVWIGTLPGTPRLVFDGPASEASWSPDGKDLYFIGDDDGLLYKATAPDFEPLPISTSMTFDLWSQLIWAVPQ